MAMVELTLRISTVKTTEVERFVVLSIQTGPLLYTS